MTRRGPVLVVGLSPCLDEEWTVGRLEPGGVHGGIAPVARAGGKAANVARTLARLGVESRLFGAVGGATGRAIASLLESDGVRADLVPARGESRRCVLVVERERRRQTVFNGVAPEVPRASLARLFERLERALRRGAEGLVVTGSLPRSAPRGLYARMVALAASAGVPSLLDSSGDGLLSGLSGRVPPRTLKVNRRELARLATGREPRSEPSTAATVRAARRVRNAFGVAEAVITGGAGPVVAIDDAATFTVRPPRVRVRSAVGAGDAFAAGLMAAPAEPLRERVARALAAAAAHCEGPPRGRRR